MTMFAVIAFAAAAWFLILGIHSMAHGGDFDKAHATRYMAGRVAAQGAAIALLALAMLATGP
jgi:hypothetical protein